MKSELLKNPRPWDERVRAMWEDLHCRYYDWLYFKVIINRMDASYNGDYEHYHLLREMEKKMKSGNIKALYGLLEKLEAL